MSTRGTNLHHFFVTYHTPENLSSAQYNYLSTQMKTLLASVYTNDKTSTEWEEIIDLESLAKYYLINEMIDHVEAFQGSCYLYKDLGEQKWKFGPLWDLGHALNSWHPKDSYIYEVEGWSPDISQELMKFPRLREEILRLWCTDGVRNMIDMYDDLHRFADTIRTAYACNYKRWPSYYRSTLEKQMNDIERQWIDKLYFLIGASMDVFDGVDETTISPSRENGSERLYDLQGRRLNKGQKGIVIRRGKKVVMKR
jgi:hypothetical protein